MLAARLTRAAGHKFTGRQEPKDDQKAWRAQDDRRRLEITRRRDIVRQALGALAQRAEKTAITDQNLWTLVCRAALEGQQAELLRQSVQRRGIQDKKRPPGTVLAGRIKDMTPAELMGLGVELLAGRRADALGQGTFGETFRFACEIYRVDLKKIDEEVRAAQREAAKPKGKLAQDVPAKGQPAA
jgi:hypothetical protein